MIRSSMTFSGTAATAPLRSPRPHASHLARDPQHSGPERRDVDGDRRDGRFGQTKAVHRERRTAEDDALARERPAEELRRLAHAGRGAGEGAAVPRLDDGLGARADAEAE